MKKRGHKSNNPTYVIAPQRGYGGKAEKSILPISGGKFNITIFYFTNKINNAATTPAAIAFSDLQCRENVEAIIQQICCWL